MKKQTQRAWETRFCPAIVNPIVKGVEGKEAIYKIGSVEIIPTGYRLEGWEFTTLVLPEGTWMEIDLIVYGDSKLLGYTIDELIEIAKQHRGTNAN